MSKVLTFVDASVCPNCRTAVLPRTAERELRGRLSGELNIKGGVAISCPKCGAGTVKFKGLRSSSATLVPATDEEKEVVSGIGWADWSDWPDAAEDPSFSTRDHVPFLFDPAFEPLTDDAIRFAADQTEDCGLGLVLGREGDRDVVNKVLDAECLEESGDWFDIETSGGHRVLLFGNQSIFVNDNVTHAKLLNIGDIVTAVDGVSVEVTHIRKLTGTHRWFRLRVSGNHTYYLNGLLMHNASRFAVATGNWSSTGIWSTTSGGGSGASVPTSSDDAFLNAASGAITVTIDVASANVCQDLTCTGFTGTLTQSSSAGTLDVYGAVLFVAGMTLTLSAITVLLRAASGAKTITMGRSTQVNMSFTFGHGGSSTATWTLQDTMNIGQNFTLTSGTAATNGQTVTVAGNCTIGASGNTNTRTLTLGASTINAANTWDVTTATGLTVTAGTSTINFTGASWKGGGKTYATVNMTSTSTVTVSAANTFGTLSRTNASGYAGLTLAANQTVTGTVTITGGNATTQRMYVTSDTQGTQRTITAAVVSISNVDFEDIIGAGAGTWSGTSIGNCGNNSGITTATPVTRYWIHGATASVAITAGTGQWSTTSGGATGASSPLPQDTAIFNASSFGASGKTVTIGTAGWRLPAIDFTGATNTPTFSVDVAATMYGSIVLVSGMTLSGSGDLTIHARLGSEIDITSAGKQFGGNITMDTVNGSYFSQFDALSLAGNLTITNGNYDSFGMSVTCAKLISSNSNTRSVSVYDSTLTLTGTGTVLDFGTSTNLTVDFSGGTVAVTNASSSAKTVDLGGKTINNLTLSGAGSGSYTIQGTSSTISGTTTVSNTGGASVTLFGSASMTHTTLNFTGFTGVFAGSTAGTIAGALTLVGTMTATNTGTLTFTATSSVAIAGASVSLPCSLTLDGVGGTWTLSSSLVCTGTMTLTNGSFAASTFNVTCGLFSSSNANTRAITMGSGTWFLTSSGTVWDCTTTTGLTLTCGTSTIKMNDASATAKTFQGGGKTYYNVWLTGAGAGAFKFAGNNTFNEFRCDTPPHAINFKASSTTTIASWVVNGTSGNLITLDEW